MLWNQRPRDIGLEHRSIMGIPYSHQEVWSLPFPNVRSYRTRGCKCSGEGKDLRTRGCLFKWVLVIWNKVLKEMAETSTMILFKRYLDIFMNRKGLEGLGQMHAYDIG